jgi:hypothetical protein
MKSLLIYVREEEEITKTVGIITQGKKIVKAFCRTSAFFPKKKGFQCWNPLFKINAF